MKKLISIILLVVLVMPLALSISASAASEKYVATAKINVYRYSSCRTRGTCSPAKSYNASISAGDDCYIYKVTSSYVQVNYPTSSGRRTGYITRSDYNSKIRKTSTATNSGTNSSSNQSTNRSNADIRNKMVSILYNNNGGKMSCDFDGYVSLKQKYGYRHEGIDFCNYGGAKVYSLINGTVVSAGGSLGTIAIYDSANNKTVVYLHTNKIQVSAGQQVSRGTLLAYESNKGTDSIHTHVEVRNGKCSGAAKSLDKTLSNSNPYSYWNKVLFNSSGSTQLTLGPTTPSISPTTPTVQPATNKVTAPASKVLFDHDYYRRKYSDLNAAFGNNEQALYNHFITYGKKEGRSPSPFYDAAYYKNAYSDLRKAFGNNWSAYYDHWVNHGIKEYRKASPIYDGNYYRNQYGDLRNAFGNDGGAYINHFLQYGMNEGRQASASFKLSVYKRHSDLVRAYGSNNKEYFTHYMIYGRNEGRRAS